MTLVIDNMNRRGAREYGLRWFRRSDEQHGEAEVTVEPRDPSTGESNALTQHFWIRRALDAGALAAGLNIRDAVTADGTAEPLGSGLGIETAPLNETAARLRSYGHREPEA